MTTELLIYEDIGDWFDGVTATSVAEELNQVPTTESQVDVRINSLGGNTSDGIAIRTLFRSFATKRRVFNPQFKLRTLVDGFAYSAASIIATAGDEIVMNQGSLMMIHRAWTWGMGNEEELTDLAAYLRKIDGEIASIYATLTGGKPEQMLALMKAETYFNADEAVAAKLAHSKDEHHSADMSRHGDVANQLSSKQPGKYINLMKSRCGNRLLPTAAHGGSKKDSGPDTTWLIGAELQSEIDKLLH